MVPLELVLRSISPSDGIGFERPAKSVVDAVCDFPVVSVSDSNSTGSTTRFLCVAVPFALSFANFEASGWSCPSEKWTHQSQKIAWFKLMQDLLDCVMLGGAP
jgi:hypothetical protein